MIGQKLKTVPPTGGHIEHKIFELGRDFIGAKLLTKFHEDGTTNQMLTDGRTYVGQRPVRKAHLSNQFAHLRETNILFHDPRPIRTIFKLVRDINKTNVLTNFHDDWAKIVPSRVCQYIHIEKNAPPTGGHAFSPISTIFELVRDIN
ncbi:hypothetical protein DPMN_183927 [Dreissena polymorpha]|uniref:Uncharacterized protein n=1 Tax=Dreissena polymorpha TaxID=45954 RepID=A0A9D4DHI8_DREPO|nr:hypothetical protein DPMN_183927 [Dreissena polymorpha]